MSEKSKNILLGVLIVGLVSMTVAYAALSTSLTINGTANVAATKWDIHFANVAVDSTETTTGLVYDLGTLDNHAATTGTGTLINGLTVQLNKPGDKLVVNFDIENAGTIDAKNTTMTKSIRLGEGAATSGMTNDVVNYSIRCGSGANGDNSVLAKARNSNTPTAAACTLTIEYNDTASSITQESQTAGYNQAIDVAGKTFTFDANWVYVQN